MVKVLRNPTNKQYVLETLVMFRLVLVLRLCTVDNIVGKLKDEIGKITQR
jgi:hypothetical protein